VFKEFEANVGKFDNIEILRGDSVEMAAKSPTVDMVFIDGSHEYEAVKADILAWKDKATKLICGHDLDRPGVRKAVAEVFGARVGLATGTIWQVWL
jgi:predicted O-methyltransferase YrrM